MSDPRLYPLERGPSAVDVGLPDAETWAMGPVRIIKGFEQSRWHVSMSCLDRLPTWDEIKEVRHRLLPPDTFYCLLFPPEKYWMSYHPYCLHLWEIRDETLLRQMIDSAPERSGNLVLP